MNTFTACVVYFLTWWVTLFAVLPFGVKPDDVGDPEQGGWRGAPQQPRMGRKLLATTLIAFVIFLGIWSLIQSDWLSFRAEWLAIPDR